MIFCDTLVQPELFGFQIGLQQRFRITLKICDIEAVFGKLIDVSKQLPGVSDSFFLRRLSVLIIHGE